MTGNCRDTVAAFGDYVEDALPVPLTASVEAHLADCPRCREFLASLRALPAAVRDVLADPVPPDLANHVLRRLDARQRRKQT
jgi:anti-sigma factor RsiW